MSKCIVAIHDDAMEEINETLIRMQDATLKLSKWISVKDKLPIYKNYSERVLAVRHCCTGDGGPAHICMYWMFEDKWIKDGDSKPDPCFAITHWMPLPEFP